MKKAQKLPPSPAPLLSLADLKKARRKLSRQEYPAPTGARNTTVFETRIGRAASQMEQLTTGPRPYPSKYYVGYNAGEFTYYSPPPAGWLPGPDQQYFVGSTEPSGLGIRIQEGAHWHDSSSGFVYRWCDADEVWVLIDPQPEFRLVIEGGMGTEGIFTGAVAVSTRKVASLPVASAPSRFSFSQLVAKSRIA